MCDWFIEKLLECWEMDVFWMVFIKIRYGKKLSYFIGICYVVLELKIIVFVDV